MTHLIPLSERVLTRIEAERVVPRARWTFVARNYVFWMLGGFAVFLGALAFAGGVFESSHAGWRVEGLSATRPFAFLFELALYLWTLALLLCIALGYLTIRHTARGYRYSIGLLALTAIIVSLFLGGVLYVLDFGRAVACSVPMPFRAETTIAGERNELCRGTRPYTQFQKLPELR